MFRRETGITTAKNNYQGRNKGAWLSAAVAFCVAGKVYLRLSDTCFGYHQNSLGGSHCPAAMTRLLHPERKNKTGSTAPHTSHTHPTMQQTTVEKMASKMVENMVENMVEAREERRS